MFVMKMLKGTGCCVALTLCAAFATAQTPERTGNFVAIDECKSVKPPDGAYEESHYEYHCTFRFALSDAAKGKACVLVTTTPPASVPLPCQSRSEQRFEESIVFTVGSPAKSVYQVTQGDALIGAVTVIWDESHEWLTITGNYGGNYKPTSPCAGTQGGSC